VKLVLWDIDGTLLSTGGVAAAAMREAMASVFGHVPAEERVSYAGKTDSQILLESYRHVTLEALAGHMEQVSSIYVELLDARRALLVERSLVLPGVPAMLQALRGRALQGLLTGNIARVARFKLDALGLLEHIDLAASAFGDDHHQRGELVAVAARRAAARYGRSFAPGEIVIVGDTPNDIACARAGGARAVAVATGAFGLDELREHNPDALLPNLEAPGALEAILAS
jgi:phosphoglycolate phosphatase-like HAD superfamily hydrolase